MVDKIFGGVNYGTTLIQTDGNIGGARYVFVKKQGIKDDLVFPPFGGQLKNPFPGAAKFFAGDLCEYRTNEDGYAPEIYLLKTYLVAKETSDTTVLIARDGYKHIPFVGDVLMKAPASFAAKGAAYTVTAVEETTESGADVWKLTLNTALGSLAKGDILVEAKAESASDGEMVVQNPNTVVPADYDCFYDPATSSDKKKARYFFTPALHGTMYISRMSPLPDVVKALNKSRINGWFEI